MANETLEQLGNALEAAQQKIGAVAEEVSEQAYNELVAIRREKLRGLQEAGNDPFELTSYPQADFAAEVKESFVDVPEGEQGRSVCMAGRMMSKRVMGKASFADLRDTTGNIQLYVRRDDVGVEEYQAFKKFDIGDIIGVRGFVFRTKMGEISVHVTEIVLLSKSLLPLPEKFHGLKDREARYRQRYVDLIVNPEVRKTFEVRSKFIRHMRNYLDERGYMEVETPVLNTIAGGAAARPFVTHHNTLDIDMYMRIATELPLKRLIVGGIDRVYEIGRIFRNEGMDPKHNPEFTTVELYQAYADFHTMMDIAEGILSSAALELLGGVTTIRTVGGLADFDTRCRDGAAKGKILAPRILAANEGISVPGGHMAGSVAVAAHNNAEALAQLRRAGEQGVDLVKLMITGGVLDATQKGTPGELKMKPEMVRAVCDEAHRLGYPVAAHTESPEGVKVALENGVDSIEHGAKMDEETIQLYKERGAFVCTTISPALPYALFDPAISGASEKDQYNGRIVFDGVVESARTALANGIPVGLGNDVGCPYVTQYDFWRELCYFHKYCGVSNQFALYTATLRNARLAGVGDVTGSIEAGKSADFIVTRKNPLDDLAALRQLELVVCRGRAVHKPAPKRNKTVDALLDPYLA